MIKLLLLLSLIGTEVLAQTSSRATRFTGRERLIIYDIINQFKKECGHVSLLDQLKLSEIQSVYSKAGEELKFEQKECFSTYLSQIVGGHRIYKDICDEVTPKKRYGRDASLARIFSYIKKYDNGIKPFHEKLNDCLVRTEAPKEVIVKYSDYENNLRAISKKIREMNTLLPFKENNVDLR